MSSNEIDPTKESFYPRCPECGAEVTIPMEARPDDEFECPECGFNNSFEGWTEDEEWEPNE